MNAAFSSLPLRPWVLLAMCIAAAACPPAAAHEGRPILAELVLWPDGAAELVLSDDAAGLADMLGAPAAAPDGGDGPAAARVRLERVLDRIGAGIALTSDRGPLGLRPGGLEVAPDTGIARITWQGRVPEGAASLTWRLDPALGDSVIRVRRSGEPEPYAATFVRGGETTPPLAIDTPAPQSFGAVFASYVVVGFWHIVPLGLDHILFVVGLFLLSPRMRPLIWQVTMFTLAHTVTLALGLTGVVRVPGEIVEPLIAASIAFVAIDNLRGDRMGRWRPAVVFAFGLLHGLGFAGVLAEYGLPPGQFLPALLAFNIGVEIGQITVLAACFLAVGLWFGTRPWYRRAVTIPGSLAIAAVALVWVVERTGLAAV